MPAVSASRLVHSVTGGSRGGGGFIDIIGVEELLNWVEQNSLYMSGVEKMYIKAK
jgi:hypothetical protein